MTSFKTVWRGLARNIFSWSFSVFRIGETILLRSLNYISLPASRVPAEPDTQNDRVPQQPPRFAASYFIALIYLSISYRLIELKLACTVKLPQPLIRFCERWFFTLRSGVSPRPPHLRPPGLNPWGPGGCPLPIPSRTGHLSLHSLAPPCKINTCSTLSSSVLPSFLSLPSWNEKVLSPKWKVWNGSYGLRAFCFLGHNFLILWWKGFFHCCWQLYPQKQTTSSIWFSNIFLCWQLTVHNDNRKRSAQSNPLTYLNNLWYWC